MANVKKTIGRVPVWISQYEAGRTYQKYNIVGMYGSAYISLIDNNASAPATADGEGNVTVNAGWDILADGSAVYKFSDKVAQIRTALSSVLAEFGCYAGGTELPMTVRTSGKYVDSDGDETSQSGMAISAPLEFRAGNVYLFPCSQALGTGVAVFARMVTNTYDKVIVYAYTYDQQGRISTATADYDTSLVYTYAYGENDTVTITGKDGETVPELPATHQVTESFYEPLFRTSDASMPESGSYLFLCTSDMQVVVSGRQADIEDGSVTGVRWGVLASIATNFVGAPGQKVIAQAFAELYAELRALGSVVDNMGHLRARRLTLDNFPEICGTPMCSSGEGAPAAPPTVPFQEYYDSSNNKFYKAKGVLPDTPTTADWVAIN